MKKELNMYYPTIETLWSKLCYNEGSYMQILCKLNYDNSLLGYRSTSIYKSNKYLQTKINVCQNNNNNNKNIKDFKVAFYFF